MLILLYKACKRKNYFTKLKFWHLRAILCSPGWSHLCSSINRWRHIFCSFYICCSPPLSAGVKYWTVLCVFELHIILLPFKIHLIDISQSKSSVCLFDPWTEKTTDVLFYISSQERIPNFKNSNCHLSIMPWRVT